MLVGRDDEDALDAAALAAAVGLRDVAGYLAGGMTSWREERRAVERVERLTVPELRERWRPTRIQILDVRERDEWDARPHPRLGPRALPRPPRPAGRDRPGPAGRRDLRVGQRAAVAASLLARHGARHVIHVVDGGVGRWERLSTG